MAEFLLSTFLRSSIHFPTFSSLFVTTLPPPPCCHFIAIFLHAKSSLVGRISSFSLSLSLSWLLQSRNAIFFFERFYENFDEDFFRLFWFGELAARLTRTLDKNKLILTIYNYCNLYVSHYQDEHFFSSSESIIHKNTIFFRPAIERIKKNPPNPYTLWRTSLWLPWEHAFYLQIAQNSWWCMIFQKHEKKTKSNQLYVSFLSIAAYLLDI